MPRRQSIVASRADRPHNEVMVIEQIVGMLDEPPARQSDADGRRTTLEQPALQLMLKAKHGPAQARLRNIKSRGRAAEVAL
ncbi:MAG: hypothetical protein ABSD82_06830 [Solirubrobacteraceae bacterium]|jgi:hypothetical protein